MEKYPALHRAIVSALRNARRKKGVSQRKLSEDLKEVHNFINVLEKGQHGISAESFIMICRRLDTDPHEVLEDVLRRI
jgi:ribosome-binding protein aMBF1 (putative translation factor)